MNILNEILALIMYTVITSVGVIIIYKLSNIANKYIDKIQTTTKLVEYERLNKLIDSAQKVVTNIVESVSQTYVSGLKNEGKFNKDSHEIAKNMAMSQAKEMINDEAAKAIETVYGDLDSYLDILIERTVAELKKN